MNRNQIRYFIASAEAGSFSKAALREFVSAPAMKMQVDALEGELQISLFYRSNRGLLMTEEGKHFLNFCYKMERSLNEEIRLLRGEEHGNQNIVRIGYNTKQIRENYYYCALQKYKAKHPEMSVSFEESETFDLDRFDLFLDSLPEGAAQFKKHKLCKLPITCLIPSEHCLARCKSVDIEDLGTERLVLPSEELIRLISPDLPMALSKIKCPDFSYNDSKISFDDYINRGIMDKHIALFIGISEYVPPLFYQVPLRGYWFEYNIYSYKSIRKNEAAAEYVACLQKYYDENIRSASV